MTNPRSSSDTTSHSESIEWWDAFWMKIIEHYDPENWDSRIVPFQINHRLVGPLRRWKWSSILFSDNGISQEPRAFAHAGFNCTVLDLSSVATMYAREFPFSDRHLHVFYQMSEDELTIGDFRMSEARPGGSLQFLQGDFLDPMVCPGPYDVIISRRALQYYSSDELPKVLRRLTTRLRENGVIVIEVHNDLEAKEIIQSELDMLDFDHFSSVQKRLEPPQRPSYVLLFGTG